MILSLWHVNFILPTVAILRAHFDRGRRLTQFPLEALGIEIYAEGAKCHFATGSVMAAEEAL
jgi:hypothetical protein